MIELNSKGFQPSHSYNAHACSSKVFAAALSVALVLGTAPALGSVAYASDQLEPASVVGSDAQIAIAATNADLVEPEPVVSLLDTTAAALGGLGTSSMAIQSTGSYQAAVPAFTSLVPMADAKIGDTEYTSLSDAITAATDDDVIVLDGDVTLAAAIDITKSLEIDLNGHTINSSTTTAFYVKDGSLTVSDSSDDQRGAITAQNQAICVQGAGSSLTISAGTIGTAKYAVNNFGGKVTVSGGALTASVVGIFNQKATGSGAAAGSVVVTGGKVAADQVAIVNRGGDLKISGGTVSGKLGGIEDTVFGGDIKVSGGTVSSDQGTAIYTESGTVAVSGSAAIKTEAQQAGKYAIVAKKSESGAQATVRISDSASVTAEKDGMCAIALFGNSGFTMTGGTVSANGFALANNGASSNGTTMEISGGSLTSAASHAIYHPGIGTLDVSGSAVITGATTGIEMRSGVLTMTGGTVEGGTVEGRAIDLAVSSNGNGPTTDGAGIVMSQHTTKNPVTINISGGSVKGRVALLEVSPESSPNLANLSLAVSGGTFNNTGSESPATYVDASGATITLDSGVAMYVEDCNTSAGHLANFVTGGSFSSSVSPSYCDSDFQPVAELDAQGNPTGRYTVKEKEEPTPTPPTPTPTVEKVTMYRLYNPYSGEHFYTGSVSERDQVKAAGWNDEGTGWIAPKTSSTPVYRLYNQYAGDHHYTTSATERDSLVKLGWNDEGTGWYSADAKTTPLYRQYNPFATTGSHNYTTSKSENDQLVALGWKAEGIGWYGL